MARPTKSKSIENRNKVVAEIIKDPTKSANQIAKETGVPKSSAYDTLNKSEEFGKSTDIIKICDNDKKIVEMEQKLVAMKFNRLLEKAEDNKENLDGMNVTEISNVGKNSTARYSMFRGEATDDNGGLKNNVSEMTTEELLKKMQE